MHLTNATDMIKENGLKRDWDSMKAHDSVVIMVFNKTRKVFIMVKQFRPAIYIDSAELVERNGETVIDTDKYPGSLGVSYELCAGIVDKDVSTQEIAQMEVLEECGYKVALDSIEKVATYRSGVGVTGSKQTLFFVEVTDPMKVGEGGGLEEEGEMIDVIEVPLQQGWDFISDEKKCVSLSVLYAFSWFHGKKSSQYS